MTSIVLETDSISRISSNNYNVRTLGLGFSIIAYWHIFSPLGDVLEAPSWIFQSSTVCEKWQGFSTSSFRQTRRNETGVDVPKDLFLLSSKRRASSGRRILFVPFSDRHSPREGRGDLLVPRDDRRGILCAARRKGDENKRWGRATALSTGNTLLLALRACLSYVTLA